MSNRGKLEKFNNEVAKKFGGYAFSGYRRAMAWDNDDETPFSKIDVYGDYGDYGNMAEPDDAIFVPSERLSECLDYLKKNRPAIVEGLAVAEKTK